MGRSLHDQSSKFDERPDADNNVWIFPATSAGAKEGLLYDIVNSNGKLVERVQLPTDCVVAGFGSESVVYFGPYDRAGKSWTLERSRIVRQ
ncbi:MAG: hypothetical protein ABJB66_07205 [Gemmatimonadaceae bacterium]